MTRLQKGAADFMVDVEFIQTINVDINGKARGKIFPIYKLHDLLEGKSEIVNVSNIFGLQCEIPQSIKEISEKFENTNMVLDLDTLQVAPWCDDNSLAMVFYDMYNITTYNPTPFNPRLLAKLKLKELEDYGYKLLIGVENEFSIFDKITRIPITNTKHMFENFVATTKFLPYVKKLNSKLYKMGIKMDSWNVEYGKGQIEIPLIPYIGMEGLDNVWLFREISKYVADDMGLIASYMTTPLNNDISNGMHINHSLLKSLDLENVMKSEEADNKLSIVGKHWLAGLIKHSRALTAIMNPTVNCYRRIRQERFATSKLTWDYDSRHVSYRVKTDAKISNKNYIENRNPSSSCNIYLAIAGMIVAGLDGIKNQLSLSIPGKEELCENVPTSLKESLKALGDDNVLKEGLGETFVNWFIKAKMECEVQIMNNVDLEEDIDYSEFNRYILL